MTNDGKKKFKGGGHVHKQHHAVPRRASNLDIHLVKVFQRKEKVSTRQVTRPNSATCWNLFGLADSLVYHTQIYQPASAKNLIYKEVEGTASGDGQQGPGISTFWRGTVNSILSTSYVLQLTHRCKVGSLWKPNEMMGRKEEGAYHCSQKSFSSW